MALHSYAIRFSNGLGCVRRVFVVSCFACGLARASLPRFASEGRAPHPIFLKRPHPSMIEGRPCIIHVVQGRISLFSAH
jgi:hypothetical protein